jgi:hypothetical protein
MTNAYARVAAAALLILTTMAGAGVASAVAQTQTAERSADLAIEQDSYVESGVSMNQSGDVPTYRVEGPVRIVPRNFAYRNVTDFGADGEATLSYDREMAQYEFSASKAGTYEVYWTVAERREVAVNGTNETETQLVKVRYVARINIDTEAMAHIPQSKIEQQREDAENWRSVNASLVDIFGSDVDQQGKLQEAVWFWKAQKNPLSAFSGQFSAVIVMLTITIGGLLVVATGGIVHYLSRRSDIRYRNKHESLKADEADLTERLLELDDQERKRVIANWDWQEIFSDDAVARAWRDTFGEDVLEGLVKYGSLREPRNLVHDRLQAMGQSGYVAVVDESVATDGGAGAAGEEIVSAHIESEDAVAPDEETIALDAPDDNLLDAIDWDDPVMRGFDLASADIDPDALETNPRARSLEELLEVVDEQREEFDDPAAFGEFYLEFVQSLREHEISDKQGRPDTLRYTFETLLRQAQLLEDRHDFALFEFDRQAISKGLAEHDAVGNASDYVKEVNDGKHN